MGIQVKPQNRTTNLQDIRFVLRNDFKDLISNKKKHTSEKDQSDLCLHDDVNMFETNGVDHRREQEQLQKENAGKGKQPECLEQAQLTSDNDEYSYYNLGHRTSFSPKKCGADNKIRHLNREPSQQITVLYDCWKTEHNQLEGKAESRAHHGVYIEDKAGNDSNPWKKIEQHYDSESSEPPSEKHYSDVLGHLRELDLALDEEMFSTSDEEGASIISLKTGREYTSDEGDEQSDRTTTLSQDWSGVKGLESDQENHGRVCQRTLTSSTMEEEDIATSISVQDSISSCKINIQTSKHLMQQAFSALDRTMRSYNSEIGTIQKSKKENQISDQIEKTPCTNLLGYDEMDYPRQNAKGNKQIKSSNEGHLVIPIAVAPPACYQLPVSGVEKIHETNPAGHFQPTFEVLGHTEDERTTGAKGCSSDVLKTSETFADGTQTICSLKKQENVECVDYKFTHDKSVKSMPGHKDKPTTKCKKKMNVLTQVHEHENIPVRKGRISMRIPPHGDQQGSRKQCMYLSSNRKIHITQSCNVVAEGVKVRQKKNPEGHHFTNMEKPQDQNCGRTTKGKSEQASVSTNWTSDMTDIIEKMTPGCLPVGQGESKQQNSPRTEHVDEEELFRQFAKQPRRSMKQPHPSNRQFVHSVDHQQMKYNPYYTPEEAHIESDNSLEMEKSLQSVTGQRVYFDSYQSGGSEEEREITNMDKTFTTGRKQNEAQKENVQYFSPSDSSFNKSDEFFTPNSELLSLYSETSTNEDLTENQLPKESVDSEEESEINREVCQKNTISLRSSSGSDIDVVGKEVIGKVMDQRNSNRDWNEVTILSTTASAGSFSDIQDFSCIPCDRCSMDKMCSKTPLCSGGPINYSTPHSVITDTSLWQSSESSVISPGTFGTACEEASEVQNPVILPAATSVFNIAKCQMEQECGETSAATPKTPIQLTEEKAKSTEGIVLKLVEDEKDEGTGPKRMQEALDHLSDCEWYRLQKSLEEDQSQPSGIYDKFSLSNSARLLEELELFQFIPPKIIYS
ncbi:uncharacterized protein LOC132395214 [Hypanus sabinus]|uniref:uncharacterized protein LOC132395214 n=1 Tax=Hypanus sabinus TaxID=79690 RepID=UPI0028C4EEA7|nr:uncharacterized protein LOC132395214 [Hypanus sabinus]